MSCCNSNCNHDPCGSSFNQSLTRAAQYAQYAQTQANKSESLWEEFNALYLGAFAVAPTQDNQGNPLQVGALYWNTGASELYAWNGLAWVTATGFNEFTPFLATGSTTPRNLATRMADVVNVKDFGAVGDGVTDDTAAFINAFSSVIASGGGTIFVPDGIYSIRQKITVTCNAQQHITLTGCGRYQSTLKFGGAADLGISFISTSLSNNQLPSFEVTGIGIIASRDNVGTALSFDYANSNNIDATVNLSNIFIGQDVDNPSESGSGYGYWSRGIYCNNCRNGEIQNLHFFGEMNKAPNLTSSGITLSGESTSFVISSTLILESTTGIYITGTTEGVYVHNSDIVGVYYGVYYNIASGAEPQLTVTDSHINAQNAGVWTVNVQQSVIANCLIYANSWLSTSSWPAWTGVLFQGPNSRYNKVIGCTFAKENQRTGDTTTAIDFNAGSHYSATGNHFFGFNGNQLTYGIVVRAGVSECIIGDDNIFNYVTGKTSISPTALKISDQPLIRSGTGVYANGATVTFDQAFPNNAYSVTANHNGTSITTIVSTSSLTTTGFVVNHNGAGNIAINWIATGK